jgi:hypothetical protein
VSVVIFVEILKNPLLKFGAIPAGTDPAKGNRKTEVLLEPM